MSGYYLGVDRDGKFVLAHYGIKGQQWGVRRFQNEDRTWTEAGKIRYGGSGSSKDKTMYGSKNTKSSNKQDLTKTKLKDIDHKREGDTSGEIAKLAVNTLISVATLNPIGAASNIHRIGSAVRANSNEKKAAKRISNAEIDKKTGLPLKSKELTPEQDCKLTNPGYKNFNTNTKNNCVLCTHTFELRRRGYDVIAQKAGFGFNEQEYRKWFKGAKSESAGFDPWTVPNMKRSKEIQDWANERILKQGNGARGELFVKTGGYAGHSMAYEVKDNKIVVYDAQSGKKYNMASVGRFAVDVGFARLDNCEPDLVAMRKAGVFNA